MRLLSIAAFVGLASTASIPSTKVVARGMCDPGQGRESNTSGNCITCLAGTFGLGGGGTCTPCPSGSTSALGSAYCTCSPGYYLPGGVASAANASIPAVGEVTTGLGATTGTECALCPAGQSSSAGAVVCTSCLANTYSTSGGLCTPCPSGTSSVAGSSQCTTLSCPAGQYPYGNACANCPAGTYSAAGDASCTGCSPGAISNPGSSTCTACPGGSVPSSSGNSCSTCPRNTYSNGDNCSACASGSTSNPGSSSCGPQPSSRAVQPVLDACSSTPGYQRCPIFNGRGGTECINVLTTLDSCGGCVGPEGDDEPSSTGQDCSAIPHVNQVECEQGRCKVTSCRAGYIPGEGACLAVPSSTAKRTKTHGLDSF
ncbi:hypothetical protein FRC08_015923 [Ceratobasidium sp. 394]|nr:hypothetical protein FRC08_015923 [Ceratobasidium sp. 394]